MSGIFIYWDNSNIFHEAQRLAEQREKSPEARYRVRIHFDNLHDLALAGRRLEKAIAAGSVPPSMRQMWNRLENSGVEVKLFDRGVPGRGEQEVPDQMLQIQMLGDAIDYNGDPGTAVVLTGDGAGYYEGSGFHRNLERLSKRGWNIEVLSWKHSCNKRMREWAEGNGVFVALDDFYESITFLEPSSPGHEIAPSREAMPLDLSRRAGAGMVP